MKKHLRIHTTTAGDIKLAAGICWGRESILECFTRIRQGDPKAEISLFEFLMFSYEKKHFQGQNNNADQATVLSYAVRTVNANAKMFSPDMGPDDWKAIYTAVAARAKPRAWATPDEIQDALGSLFTFEVINRPTPR